MDTLLRKLAEWKGRRKAAQIIIFDGGAEVQRTKSFVRGALTGIGLTLGVFALSAPTSGDPELLEHVRLQEEMISDARARLNQAVQVAGLCVSTAANLEQTLSTYQAFLGSRGALDPRFRATVAPPAASQ